MSAIVFNSLTPDPSFKDQVNNFQTTLASLNQQVISLRETLQKRDLEIVELKNDTSRVGSDSREVKRDDTLTIVGALINLYKLLFPPGKVL